MLKKLRNNKTLNKIGAWINNNKVVKLIVAASLVLIRMIAKSFVVWITGLLLVDYLADLKFISFYQCILVCLWFNIIIFNFKKDKQ